VRGGGAGRSRRFGDARGRVRRERGVGPRRGDRRGGDARARGRRRRRHGGRPVSRRRGRIAALGRPGAAGGLYHPVRALVTGGGGGSSDPRWWTGCWPRVGRSTPSTISPPARWRT